MLNKLVANHHVVEALWSAVNTSSGSLEHVAPLVKRVLTTGAWKRRIVPQLGNEPIEFQRFIEFIETAPLKGCGWPPNKVAALIKDDTETLALWHEAITPPTGVHHDSSNITTKRGTTRAYTLNRLKRKRPDLF